MNKVPQTEGPNPRRLQAPLCVPRTLPALFLALCAVAAAISCAPEGEEHPAGQTGQPRLNLLVISIDTLRSDHLGCYGYEKDTTPNIDRFALTGTVFANSYAQAPATLISHASMLTGLLPAAHRADASIRQPLPEDRITLAEYLKLRGYRTAAITGGAQLDNSFGLSQGFDTYFDGGVGPGVLKRKVGIARIYDEASKVLETAAGEGQPFFLFLHTYQTHHPYEPPRELSDRFDPDYQGTMDGSLETLRRIDAGEVKIETRDVEHIVALYDGEIRYTDEYLGKLFARIESLGLSERTVVILTSDHGEEFFEHGKVGKHAHTLFEELLKVPLIIHSPLVASHGVDTRTLARGIDLLPTAVDLLGLVPPQDIHGRSLVPAMTRSKEPDPVYNISEMESWGMPDRLASIQDLQFKLILEESGPMLFDLTRDPQEQMNLVFKNRTVSFALLETLNETLMSLKPGLHLLFAPSSDADRFRLTVQSAGRCSVVLDPRLFKTASGKDDAGREIKLDIPKGSKTRQLLIRVDPPDAATTASVFLNGQEIPPDRLLLAREVAAPPARTSTGIDLMSPELLVLSAPLTANLPPPWVRVWSIGARKQAPLNLQEDPELAERLRSLGYLQ